MQLNYLLFDTTDEDSGHGSFDAMATVAPSRLGELLAELSAVLRWAHARFGPPAGQREEADWDFDLQATQAPNQPARIEYDEPTGEVALQPDPASGEAQAMLTVTLTLSGSPAFCEALRTAFELDPQD